MNVVLLTAVIFAVALDHGAQGKRVQPCQKISDNNAYNTFVEKHILDKRKLGTNSVASWERYLTKMELCGRVPVQSFIDALESDVQQICREDGQRVKNEGNLCISNRIMTVFDVESKQDRHGRCKVKTTPSPCRQKVVVGCDKVGNQCLPVHFEGYNNQQPTNVPCSGPHRFVSAVRFIIP